MARPTTKRRLRDIDPNDFGVVVGQLVETHVTDLLPLIERDVIAKHVAEVSAKASLLAQYARDGGSLERVTAALVTVGVWLEKLDVCEDIRTVLHAVHARLRLARNEGISARGLASLAGVDPDHVRLLARQGEITITDGVVAPQLAKQWLTARGVTGEWKWS